MSLLQKRLDNLRPLNQSRGNRFQGTSLMAEGQLQMIGGRLVGYADNTENYIVRGYNVNDIIYSIVNLIVEKCKVTSFGLYKIKDEQAYKNLQSLKGKKDISATEYVKILSLQDKALTPVTDPGLGPLSKWFELLKYPNPEDCFSEFAGNSISYKLITGNKYIYGDPIKGGANAGVPNELTLLPSQWVSIFATLEKFPARVSGYVIPVYGLNFTPQQVAHEKFFNPNWAINGDQLYGMSPLRAALLRIKKNNSLTEAEASTFQNEGVKGVLFMKNQVGNVDGDLVLPELNKLKETYMQEWTGTENRGRIGLTGYEVGYIPIGMTSEEMEVIESTYLDLRFFCNVFGGVPSQLLNDPASRTYNTQKEVEKALTIRCAVPRLNEVKNTLNRKGAEDWGLPKGYVIDYDMSCYPELQADVKETADWTSKLIAISPNEQRELCGLAALPDEEMSQPWVTSMGRTPLSDYQANIVDESLNNNNDIDEDDTDEAGDQEDGL
jgi:phage portal protein BeeE